MGEKGIQSVFFGIAFYNSSLVLPESFPLFFSLYTLLFPLFLSADFLFGEDRKPRKNWKSKKQRSILFGEANIKKPFYISKKRKCKGREDSVGVFE
jgi:hypothetical protein